QLKDFLRSRGERDVPRRGLLAPANNLFYLLPHYFELDAKPCQRPGCDAFALVNETEQKVLSADVVVVEHPGLFLSQDHNPSRPVGKPLEHAALRIRAGQPPSARPRPAVQFRGLDLQRTRQRKGSHPADCFIALLAWRPLVSVPSARACPRKS